MCYLFGCSFVSSLIRPAHPEYPINVKSPVLMGNMFDNHPHHPILHHVCICLIFYAYWLYMMYVYIYIHMCIQKPLAPPHPIQFAHPMPWRKGAGRAAFDKLWWQQTQEELLRDALHGPDDAEVRLHAPGMGEGGEWVGHPYYALVI